MHTKKGISIMSIMIMVVILVIISGTVLISGSGMVKKTKIKKFGTEMLQVEEVTQQYVKRNSGNINWETISIDPASLSDEEKNQYSKEGLLNELQLYIVNLQDIGAETASYGLDYKNKLSKDLFLWSSKTNKVYYRKGYEYQDKIYYTITNELLDLIK